MNVPATLRVRRLRPEAVLPSRAHEFDAGIDLASIENASVEPGGRATIGTGIAVEVPTGWTGLVCRRSGLASRRGVGLVGGPGVVDAGYSGEIKVILHNADPRETLEIECGDRIAQLVIVPVLLAEIVEVDHWAPSPVAGGPSRGVAGFGSTGVRS